MTTLIDITLIAQSDPAAIEALLDAAFGADRHGRTAYRLRAGCAAIAHCSFAAHEGDRLVGSVQCWPAALTAEDGRSVPLTLVGPIAVLPDRQRDGIGRLLTERAIAAAEAAGEDAFVLIGDPEYYGRFFGFDAGPTAGWTVPGPVERRRLLARLAPGRVLPAIGSLGPRC